MNVRVYTSFDDIPAEVRRTFSYPQQPSFFVSFDWFALLYRSALQQAWRPRIYVLSGGDGSPVAALFCGTSIDDTQRTLRSLTNFYSITYALSLARAGLDEAALLERLIAHIAAERPRWHAVQLQLLEQPGRLAGLVSERLRATGFAPQDYFQYENWTLPLGGESFEDYFAHRPSQVRNTITRKAKKLQKTHRSEIVVHRDRGPALDAAIEAFAAIYNASWKQPEPFPAFIPALVRTAADLGVLRLGVLSVDDRPAAAQLWISGSGRAVIYKLAYDEEHADLGVGSILSKEMFRLAIDDDRVAEIDYGVGSESYKKDWMLEVRRLGGIEAPNQRTLRGWTMGLANASRARLRGLRAAWQRATAAADP